MKKRIDEEYAFTVEVASFLRGDHTGGFWKEPRKEADS